MRSKGFTIVEMMIASVVLFCILVGIYMFFRGATKFWGKDRERLEGEKTVREFLYGEIGDQQGGITSTLREAYRVIEAGTSSITIGMYAIIDGGNGMCQTNRSDIGGDEQRVPVRRRCAPGAILIVPGTQATTMGTLTTESGSGDDIKFGIIKYTLVRDQIRRTIHAPAGYPNPNVIPVGTIVATNVQSFEFEYEYPECIIDGGDGIFESTLGGDDEIMGGDILYRVVIKPGPNKILESTVGGDDYIGNSSRIPYMIIDGGASGSSEGVGTDTHYYETAADSLDTEIVGVGEGIQGDSPFTILVTCGNDDEIQSIPGDTDRIDGIDQIFADDTLAISRVTIRIKVDVPDRSGTKDGKTDASAQTTVVIRNIEP